MDPDMILGCILTAVSLGVVVGVTLWCRGAINRIAEKGERTAREILKDSRK